MKLPYITAHLDGIGGQLRATPEHFVVEELPLYLPLDEGSHLYINFSKVGYTTRQIVELIEKSLRLRRGEIGYAGLKDKYAHTTQTISVPLVRATNEEVSETVERIRSEVPIEVHWARLHHNKLKTGHLLGNRFRIIVSSLEQSVETAVATAQTIATDLQQSGVPNYFGPQRFGKEGDNAAQGQALLLGKHKVRDPWLRRFLISSYQSELCNQYLAQRLNQGLFQRILSGDVAKKYATGGIFDVSEPEIDQLRFDAQEISFTAPIYGFKMRFATAEAGQLEEKILSEAGLSLDDWRKTRIEGSRRLGRLLLDDLQIESNEAGIAISFSLPKGAFATTILREFMKNECAEGVERDEEADPNE